LKCRRVDEDAGFNDRVHAVLKLQPPLKAEFPGNPLVQRAMRLDFIDVGDDAVLRSSARHDRRINIWYRRSLGLLPCVSAYRFLRPMFVKFPPWNDASLVPSFLDLGPVFYG
jgi:hypothetical protein